VKDILWHATRRLGCEVREKNQNLIKKTRSGGSGVHNQGEDRAQRRGTWVRIIGKMQGGKIASGFEKGGRRSEGRFDFVKLTRGKQEARATRGNKRLHH